MLKQMLMNSIIYHKIQLKIINTILRIKFIDVFGLINYNFTRCLS